MNSIFFCGPRYPAPKNSFVINTTSISKDFGKNFSPFLCQGDIILDGLKAHNVENLWQYTKVYGEHVDHLEEWIRWRDKGLALRRAVRYPMGKGAKPFFSRWQDKELGYIEARKTIYIPAYIQKLDKYCQRQINSLIDILSITDVYLWDFDVFPTEASFEDLVADPSISLGHGFIVAEYTKNRR